MEIMPRMRTAVVAEFGVAFEGDVEVDLVEIEVVIDPIHRLRRKVIAKYSAVFLFLCQNEGQSQLLRLCRCMFTLLLQAVQAMPATNIITMSQSIVFLFITWITEKTAFYFIRWGKL